MEIFISIIFFITLTSPLWLLELYRYLKVSGSFLLSIAKLIIVIVIIPIFYLLGILNKWFCYPFLVHYIIVLVVTIIYYYVYGKLVELDIDYDKDQAYTLYDKIIEIIFCLSMAFIGSQLGYMVYESSCS